MPGVYLFGSVAAGFARQDSDLDLAVLPSYCLPELQLWEFAQELAGFTACDVDLVDLRRASAVMRMQVISQGKLICCVDSEACEAAIDAAMHVVRVRKLGVPQQSRDAFSMMQEAGFMINLA